MYRLVNPNARINLNRLDCRQFRNLLVQSPYGMREFPNHVFPPVKIQFHHFRILRPCRQLALHSHFEHYSALTMSVASLVLYLSSHRPIYRGSCIAMVSLVQLVLTMAIHSAVVHWFSLYCFLFYYYYCRSYPVFVLFPFQLMAGRIPNRHLK